MLRNVSRLAPRILRYSGPNQPAGTPPKSQTVFTGYWRSWDRSRTQLTLSGGQPPVNLGEGIRLKEELLGSPGGDHAPVGIRDKGGFECI